MSYLYWVAECKTEGCENQRLIKFGGEYDGNKMAFLSGLAPNRLTVHCPICDKSYEYEESEIVAVIKDEPPPPGFVAPF